MASHNVCPLLPLARLDFRGTVCAVMVPAGIGFYDGQFGKMVQRACAQWARSPALGERLSGVRYALRNRLSHELLAHIWSDDMESVLGEIEWCVEHAGDGSGQMLLIPMNDRLAA